MIELFESTKGTDTKQFTKEEGSAAWLRWLTQQVIFRHLRVKTIKLLLSVKWCRTKKQGSLSSDEITSSIYSSGTSAIDRRNVCRL